jgi:cytochrome c551
MDEVRQKGVCNMSIRGILMVLGLFILGVAFSGFASYSSSVLHPAEEATIDGKKLASQHCASCHGKDLKGDKGPSLYKMGAKLSPETIEQIIRDGIAGDGKDSMGMPPFAGGSLKDDKEIAAVAQYVSSLGSTK